MELGGHLARELGLEERDTLGLWLSHHIAELIQKAESATTEEDKRLTEEAATRAILKVWSHRLTLPGHADPFAKVKNILETLQILRPDGADWHLALRSTESAPIVSLYRRIPRLVRGILALELPIDGDEKSENEEILKNFLEEDENSILAQLKVNVILYGEDVSTEHETPADTRAQLQKHVEKLISETAADLQRLREQILAKPPLNN